MLNWIVWNRTVYLYKNGFGIKSPTKVGLSQNPNKQTNKQTNTFDKDCFVTYLLLVYLQLDKKRNNLLSE